VPSQAERRARVVEIESESQVPASQRVPGTSPEERVGVRVERVRRRRRRRGDMVVGTRLDTGGVAGVDGG